MDKSDKGGMNPNDKDPKMLNRQKSQGFQFSETIETFGEWK